MITPQTPRGFRDFLPEDMKAREEVIAICKKTFQSYGYEPLETPALEYAETLLGKYGEEGNKLLYRFKDPGGREMAMKYDLTVPTCRVLAEYAQKFPLPFKRYQIQPVWRADKPQKGRFREFYQCDADSLGTSSMIADGEFIQMCTNIFQNLGFREFVTRVNNRKLTNAFVQYAAGSDAQFVDIVTAIDKLEKIGLGGVVTEMEKRKIEKNVINKILELIKIEGTNDEILSVYSKKLSGFPMARDGIDELRQIFSYLKSASVKDKFYRFDPSIVRGLAYYTGPVWETTILEGGVGSVTGCGRYDKLIGMFLYKDVPATGGSFGLERIIEVMKDRGMIKMKGAAAKVLVTVFSPDQLKNSIKIVNELRAKNVNSELYLDPAVRLEKQLKYADRKGIPFAIIAGPEEVAKKGYMLKNLNRETQVFCQNVDELIQNANLKM